MAKRRGASRENSKPSEPAEVTPESPDTPDEPLQEAEDNAAEESPLAQANDEAPEEAAPPLPEEPSREADDADDPQRGWPVEYLSQREGEAAPVVEVYRHGRVVFRPLPDEHFYGGRRIVWLPGREHVNTILAKNPPGLTLYVEPADVLSAQEITNIERIVDARIDARLAEVEAARSEQ